MRRITPPASAALPGGPLERPDMNRWGNADSGQGGTHTPFDGLRDFLGERKSNCALRMTFVVRRSGTSWSVLGVAERGPGQRIDLERIAHLFLFGHAPWTGNVDEHAASGLGRVL